eukprot:102945-Rhodomonas_salina.1
MARAMCRLCILVAIHSAIIVLVTPTGGNAEKNLAISSSLSPTPALKSATSLAAIPVPTSWTQQRAAGSRALKALHGIFDGGKQVSLRPGGLPGSMDLSCPRYTPSFHLALRGGKPRPPSKVSAPKGKEPLKQAPKGVSKPGRPAAALRKEAPKKGVTKSPKKGGLKISNPRSPVVLPPALS